MKALSLAPRAVVELLAVCALTIGAPTLVEAKTKFYLTKDGFQGNAVLTACDAGFHMASLWEIHDPSSLQYDTRGFTPADAGSGPPTVFGWIRTGFFASTSGGGAGIDNCGAWTSNVNSDFGTVASLAAQWTQSGSIISPWLADTAHCDSLHRVWCVHK